MFDPRVERLAELLVNYSLELRPGQVVRIDANAEGAPLVVALHRWALRAGAHPYEHVSLEELGEILLTEGSDDQIAFLWDVEKREYERIDALVTVWADTNTRALSGVEPDRLQRRIASRRRLSKLLWDRISAGGATWVGTRFPTHAHAQDAELSLAEYEDFVYGACHVRDDEDPVEHWRGVSTELNARARELQTVRELRIVGPDTDLTLAVDGRRWEAADGRLNMPDGEVFTSPVESATRGEIRFALPAIFNAREVEDVRLRFEDGRVVHAEAASGEDYLQSVLAMDEGARVLGELAFGLNYEIDRFTHDILFDEKIGGTIHVALGSGFKHLGSENESGLHWDLICDLRAEGEVYADGELVWRMGRFLRDPQPAVTGV